MSVITTGLACAGAGILASLARCGFAVGLLAFATAALALIAFATEPQPFSAVLIAAVAAVAAWLAMTPGQRRAGIIAAGGAGLLCAAVIPHLAVLLAHLPLDVEALLTMASALAALAVVMIGSGMGGVGGAGFGFLGFSLELGMLAAGSPTRWLIPSSLVAALLLSRRSEPVGIAALTVTVLIMITLWKA